MTLSALGGPPLSQSQCHTRSDPSINHSKVERPCAGDGNPGWVPTIVHSPTKIANCCSDLVGCGGSGSPACSSMCKRLSRSCSGGAALDRTTMCHLHGASSVSVLVAIRCVLPRPSASIASHTRRVVGVLVLSPLRQARGKGQEPPPAHIVRIPSGVGRRSAPPPPAWSSVAPFKPGQTARSALNAQRSTLNNPRSHEETPQTPSHPRA